MSTLSVRYIQGTSANNNTVEVPNGHTLQANSLNVTNTLALPSWTESTKPTSNLIVGQVGYNTELGVQEIWTGDPDAPGADPTAVGWSVAGGGATNLQSLSDAVGVTPYLHYSSDDLENYADGQALNLQYSWTNQGSLGNSYDMVNDTSGHYSSTVTVQTANGKKCAQFSGFCSLAFKSAAYYLWNASNAYPNWTVAYVFSDSSAGSGSDSTPSFNGHGQGPSTGIPDRVGGGLFGRYLQLNWGTNTAWNSWYENDGGVQAGPDAASVSVANQWINRVSSNSGLNSATSWIGKTSSPFFNGTHGGISVGTGPTYGARLILSGIGNVRRADSSAYTTSGKLYEAALFREALSDAQVQAMRDYFAAKYPFGSIAQ